MVSVFRVVQMGAKKPAKVVDHVPLSALYLFIYLKHQNVSDGVQLAQVLTVRILFSSLCYSLLYVKGN